jgi:hypothetical protein
MLVGFFSRTSGEGKNACGEEEGSSAHGRDDIIV